MKKTIDEFKITDFKLYLIERERSSNTIDKYLRDIRNFSDFLGSEQLEKTALVSYKASLQDKYAASSVNSMIAAINSYLDFVGRPDLRIKPLKIQKVLFSDEEKELKRDEYERLVRAAELCGNERLMLIIETICSTGIRVSELKFITVESIETGRAEVNCKGKYRSVFLPDDLRTLLKSYISNHGIRSGAIFITRNGKPIDRSNIWRDMKKLCEGAEVSKKKVYPHNLRHLFARTFYTLEKDLLRLADILGHSSIDTTRIYTAESGCEHIKLLEKMDLIVITT